MPMVHQALGAGFDQSSVHRLTLAVFDFRAGALACYETGLVIGGRLREARRFGDEHGTPAQMRMVQQAWVGRQRIAHTPVGGGVSPCD